MTPIPPREGGLEVLLAAGRLRPAQGRLADVEPLPEAPDGRDLSSVLSELREEER